MRGRAKRTIQTHQTNASPELVETMANEIDGIFDHLVLEIDQASFES